MNLFSTIIMSISTRKLAKIHTYLEEEVGNGERIFDEYEVVKQLQIYCNQIEKLFLNEDAINKAPIEAAISNFKKGLSWISKAVYVVEDGKINNFNKPRLIIDYYKGLIQDRIDKLNSGFE